MAVQHDKDGRIITAKSAIARPRMDLVQLMVKAQPAILQSVPKHLSGDRLSRVCMTALKTTENLSKCTPVSFLASVLSAAQLGLEVNTPLGEAWLIPRQNNKLRERTKGEYEWECTLMLGYQGMQTLSYRTGLVSSIAARAVREGDFFEYELGAEPFCRHKPSGDADRSDRPITHAWAAFKLKTGGFVLDVLSRAEINARRDRSPARNRGPWVTDYEPMACKTVIRSGWKQSPKSPDMSRALAMDDAAEVGSPLDQAVDPDVVEQLHQFGLAFDAEPEAQEDQPGAAE